jgi:hypothetical protein
MKKILILSLITALNATLLIAQKSGTFTGATGYSCQVKKIDNNTFQVTSGVRTDTYKRQGSTNVYRCTAEKYSKYLMKLESETKIKAYVEGRSGTEVVYTFRPDQGQAASDFGECEKLGYYQNKAVNDAGNAVVWSFCGLAATVVCQTQPGSDRNDRLEALVVNIKAMSSMSSNPCPDVIPASLWNAN